MIIIGLGNPGKKFEQTRHNAGFMALDFFAQKNEFPEFELLALSEVEGSKKDDILLAKPQTFMNESGRAVKEIIKNSKESTLVVVHDEIDLPLGKLKIVKDSGAGGHKGVDSIISHLGTKDFIRIKIGICPEGGKPKEVEKFVLQKFTTEEMVILQKVIKKSAEALDILIKDGPEKAMNQFN